MGMLLLVHQTGNITSTKAAGTTEAEGVGDGRAPVRGSQVRVELVDLIVDHKSLGVI